MYTLFSSFFSRDFDAIKAFASHSMKKNRKNGMDMAVVDYMMYLALFCDKISTFVKFLSMNICSKQTISFILPSKNQ